MDNETTADLLNVNAHHFGFGALSTDKLMSASLQEETITNQPASNKFKNKIMLRQKQVEVSQTTLINNRCVGAHVRESVEENAKRRGKAKEINIGGMQEFPNG